MIEAKNVIKVFPKMLTPVLKGINLKIQDNEFVSLVGRSGSGKSTLLYILSTLDRPSSGDVWYSEYGGRKVTEMSEKEIHQLRNRHIGFVFQFHYLLQELSALENILLPTRKAGLYKESKEFAYKLLESVGLKGMEDRFPSELSGGEQQRVAIARALVMKPSYLFADEPTGNLDSENGMMIMNLFEKFNRENGTTIIYVTHDQEFALKAKRKISLVNGMIE